MSRELIAFQDALMAQNVARRFVVVASVKKPLYGYETKDNAYVVDDYPFGFKLRCKIRYWVEFVPKKGYRMWSQTTDPRRPVEVWNKPKATTFAKIAGCLYLDSQDHVQFAVVTEYSNAEKCAEFVHDFPQADMKVMKLWVYGKIKFCYMMYTGKAHFTINDVAQPTSDADKARYLAEIKIWVDLAKKLHVNYPDFVDKELPL